MWVHSGAELSPGTEVRHVTLPREGDEPPPIPQLLCWQLGFILGVQNTRTLNAAGQQWVSLD